jgi:chromosome segregation protein
VRAAAARREAAERDRDRLAGELRRAEAGQAKSESALAAVVARLDTAYGVGPEALADVAPAEHPQGQRDRAAALRRELAEIGGVRPEAVAEHAAESAALAELSAAADDLRQAHAALEAWSKDLEAAIADRYTETLAQVRRQFAAIYTRLCGGGQADLVEVVPADGAAPTSTPGLELVAQPPGKQLAHLGLLSGGERTLVAVALVFAFLRVRPTAFCVLDEIEAALDEANVGRCAAFLTEIAQGTQVIAVTHQKGTMESADRLVGVTMAEPGVSRLLSVQLAG